MADLGRDPGELNLSLLESRATIEAAAQHLTQDTGNGTGRGRDRAGREGD